MSSEHKNLNHYFEAARAQESVVPLQELTASLGKVPVSGSTPAGKVSAIAGKKAALWAAGGVGALVMTTLLWFSLSEQPESLPAIAVPASTQASVVPTEQVKITEGTAMAEAKDSLWTKGATTASSAGNKVSRGSASAASASGRASVTAPGSARSVASKLDAPAQSALAEPNQGEKVFGNITLLELPREVEEKLGINVSEEGIRYERLKQDPVEGLVRLELTFLGKVMGVYIGDPTKTYVNRELTIDSSKLLLPQTKFFPLYMTKRSGELNMLYSTDSEDKRKMDFKSGYFNEMLNSMIPVLVKANNGAKNEAIFWFAATPGFLSMLPHPIRQKVIEEFDFRGFTTVIEQKYDIADSSAASVMQDTEKVTQHRYFESNRGNASTIQYAAVYPNPVSDWVHLSMNLKREEEMRVILVDINGRLVRVLSPYKRYAAGAVTEKFLIKGESTGIYILLAETKSGHRHTQRIVLE